MDKTEHAARIERRLAEANLETEKKRKLGEGEEKKGGEEKEEAANFDDILAEIEEEATFNNILTATVVSSSPSKKIEREGKYFVGKEWKQKEQEKRIGKKSEIEERNDKIWAECDPGEETKKYRHNPALHSTKECREYAETVRKSWGFTVPPLGDLKGFTFVAARESSEGVKQSVEIQAKILQRSRVPEVLECLPKQDMEALIEARLALEKISLDHVS
jgi:hypothetical protein